MAETNDGGPHIPAATVCAAIDMLREQFSVGCSEEAEDRDDWAAELDDSGFHEIATAYREWKGKEVGRERDR